MKKKIILLKTDKKINNFKNTLPYSDKLSYFFQMPPNEDILELLRHNITKDLNKNSDLDLIDIKSVISTEKITDSFSTIEEINLTAKFNLLNYDDNKMNVSSKNYLETTITNNLIKILKIIKNHLKFQISSIKEKISLKFEYDLNEAEADLNSYKKLLISNIDTFLLINQISDTKSILNDSSINEIINLRDILLESKSNWTHIINSTKIPTLNKSYYNLFDNTISSEIIEHEVYIQILKDRNKKNNDELLLNISKFFDEYDDYYELNFIDLISMNEQYLSTSYNRAILTFTGIIISGMFITLFIIFLAEGLRNNYR